MLVEAKSERWIKILDGEWNSFRFFYWWDERGYVCGCF